MHQQLLFPTNAASHYVNQALGGTSSTTSQLYRQLKHEEYSLRNRLRSIVEDRTFIGSLLPAYSRLSVFANLSCGGWYTREEEWTQLGYQIQTPCYFKSTDGHTHHWKFSDTRLNTHVILALIEPNNSKGVSEGSSSASSSSATPLPPPGALIIDSTRKGKRYPDSFSRTIPIWCAVWNRAIKQFREKMKAEEEDEERQKNGASSSSLTDLPWDTDLHMPTWVSDMETRQIESRLAGFVSTLLASGVDFRRICRGLKKPLRCLWMDRASRGWANGDADFDDLPFTPLLLLQCSRCEAESRGVGQRQGWSYIQGAGDDEDNWLMPVGLRGWTPKLLTKYEKELAQYDYDEDLIERMKEILVEEAQSSKKKDEASSSSSSSLLQDLNIDLHPIEPLHATVAITKTIPPMSAIVKKLNLPSSDSISLLYLFFDDMYALKQRRREKLAIDAERKLQRQIAADDSDAEQHQSQSDDEEGRPKSLANVDEDDDIPAIDLIDWPIEQSLVMPISSQFKSRHALHDILAPSISFINKQTQDHRRTVLIVCEDVSHLSCLLTAAKIRYDMAMANASTVESSTSAVRPKMVDKALIRSTLTSIQLLLPAHFPSRLLLKQLNTFFMNALG